MARNPYLLYASPRPNAVTALKEVVDAIGAQGASSVTYTARGAGGSVQKFTIAPAAPTSPASVVDLVGAPAAAAPGFFQTVREDGTVGPNWLRIGLAAAAGVAVVGAVVAMTRRRR